MLLACYDFDAFLIPTCALTISAIGQGDANLEF